MLANVSMLALFGLACMVSAENVNKTRDGRLLSVFNIVKFPNNPCGGHSSQNGTCYTEQECEDRDGTSQGSCAQGYGVCCIFSLNCGDKSSENTTYFQSGGGELGACKLSICKCNSNICQLRLDFNTFSITGPSTNTVSSLTNLEVGGIDSTRRSACLTDTFTVTNPGGVAPPQICGTNTGEHMYVDASENCNYLIFQLGQNAIGTGAVNRQWNIKITQYSCDYDNLAPSGCTQWFFGANTGTIQNYNYEGGHLAEQNQNICIRRERGQCRICYHAVIALTDFNLSGLQTKMGKARSDLCCGYGTNGMKTLFDCITIPGAYTGVDKKTTMHIPQQFCGRLLVSTSGGGAEATICTNRVPFNVRFLSDAYEPAVEATVVGTQEMQKFRLSYTMNAC